MKYAIAFTLLTLPAFAGDSVLDGPSPEEIIFKPYVIEIEDLGALWVQDGRFTDEQLRLFVFDGDPLPDVPQVPLPAAFWLLAGALFALRLRW